MQGDNPASWPMKLTPFSEKFLRYDFRPLFAEVDLQLLITIDYPSLIVAMLHFVFEFTALIIFNSCFS
ncbi:hypothetical protein A1342_18605 [Methylomonas methanica]|uniref:Uncharacterized protein n=1 Tax=Methylomonas denitrificans TaxID=1538553 RepID=A0A126T3Q8_9GAMM|nr:hypothetical protein JT25_009480 [Methylomonas denitrificans]OAI00036.1 hypothetical protein A1342_18605 [Methylomonas methanica]